MFIFTKINYYLGTKYPDKKLPTCVTVKAIAVLKQLTKLFSKITQPSYCLEPIINTNLITISLTQLTIT